MSETKYDPYAPPPPPVLEERYAIPEPIPPATEVFPAPEPMVASEPFPLMAGGLSSVPPDIRVVLSISMAEKNPSTMRTGAQLGSWA